MLKSVSCLVSHRFCVAHTYMWSIMPFLPQVDPAQRKSIPNENKTDNALSCRYTAFVCLGREPAIRPCDSSSTTAVAGDIHMMQIYETHDEEPTSVEHQTKNQGSSGSSDGKYPKGQVIHKPTPFFFWCPEPPPSSEERAIPAQRKHGHHAHDISAGTCYPPSLPLLSLLHTTHSIVALSTCFASRSLFLLTLLFAPPMAF